VFSGSSYADFRGSYAVVGSCLLDVALVVVLWIVITHRPQTPHVVFMALADELYGSTHVDIQYLRRLRW
jgi:hypothetical protein